MFSSWILRYFGISYLGLLLLILSAAIALPLYSLAGRRIKDVQILVRGPAGLRYLKNNRQLLIVRALTPSF